MHAAEFSAQPRSRSSCLSSPPFSFSTPHRRPAFGHCLRAAAVLACLLPASGCVDLTAVSKFASQSSQALTEGQPVLEDIAASCIRAHLVAMPVPTDNRQLFDPGLQAQAAADPACAAYTSEQPGELALLKVLTDYFTALSQLAATGTASTGKSSSSSAKSAKDKSSEPENVLNAAGSLADFLGKIAAGGYRARQLEKDLKDRKDDVAAVVAGLKDIVQSRYEGNSLVREQQVVTATDSDLVGNSTDPALKALYRTQWQGAMDSIAQKRAAADAFVKALDTMQSGYEALCNAPNLKAKDVPGIIQPYTDSLSSLIPSIQKAL